MSPSFENKVAIVTGGGSGLGEAIGKALAAKGARVVLTDINLAAAERVAGESRKRAAWQAHPPGYRQTGRL